MANKLLRDVFKVANLITSAKALVLGLLFWFVWVVWNVVGVAIASIGGFFEVLAYVLIASFAIIGLFVYGYLAKTLWGWK